MSKTSENIAAKLRSNRIQQNLLTRQLEKLDLEETKSRIKHERASIDLICFLKECRESTGYLKLSKIKPNESFSSSSFDFEHELSTSNVEICDEYTSRIMSPPQTNRDRMSADLATARPMTTAVGGGTSSRINLKRRKSAPILLLQRQSTPSNLTIEPLVENDKNEVNVEIIQEQVERPKTPKIMSKSRKPTIERKYSFNLINNAQIRINMSKSLIKRERLRIIYEYKMSAEAERLSNLRQMQNKLDNKVKEFTNGVF